MFIHFTKLPRRDLSEETFPTGGVSNLTVGSHDFYDDQHNFTHTTCDFLVATGCVWDNYVKLADRIYKSWEIRTLGKNNESYFVERLFIKTDTGDYIPYRIRVADRDGGVRTYLQYRNLEEIHKILLDSQLYGMDPRVTAMSEYSQSKQALDYVPYIDFMEYLTRDKLVTSVLGHRDDSRASLERHIDVAISDLQKAQHHVSVNMFQHVKDLLVPDKRDIPLSFLSEDVTSYTAKRLQGRLRSTNFYWDEVDPIDWQSLPNVISPQLSFRKTVSLMEDFIFTDVNVDIEVDRRDHITGIFPSIVIDRYQDLRRRPIVSTEPDDYQSIITSFIDEVYRWTYTNELDDLRDHLDRSYLIKFIKTPIEEALLLIYPYGSQHSADPLFGIYVDFAVEALCDLNANWQ